MTNLDNIKQMNSEELAEHILGIKKCSCCKYRGDICRTYTAECKSGIKAWLEQEVTPPLTDDEKVILRNIDKEYKWIARDHNPDTLSFHKEEPVKAETYCWNSDKFTVETYYWNSSEFTRVSLFDHLFQFVKWEDNEPYEISKLLGE